jgi:hypothetical protein
MVSFGAYGLWAGISTLPAWQPDASWIGAVVFGTNVDTLRRAAMMCGTGI